MRPSAQPTARSFNLDAVFWMLLIIMASAWLSACGKRSEPAPDPVPRAPASAPSKAAEPPPPVFRVAVQQAADDGLRAKGRALVEQFECHRCHDGTGLKTPPPKLHCVTCHTQILNGTFDAPEAELQQWQKNIHSLVHVPSLQGLGERVRRDWIADFLREPHDLRPLLGATMPRLAIDREQAEAIAAYLAPDPAPAFDGPVPGDPKRGRALMEAKGCGFCHRVTGIAPLAATPPAETLTDQQLARGLALAPDLRHTRARIQPHKLAAWIVEPSALSPGTAMPTFVITADEAKDMAAWILTAPMSKPTPSARPPRLPVLERKVGYDEVEARVFRKVCWHCHADPDFAEGDGGPGNTGGFGFPGRGLSLASYEEAASGFIGSDGARQSVFKPFDGGEPHLLAALLARQSEEMGQPIEGIRGMPLGLPSLSPEDIQLVESWIAQGRRY